MKISPYSEGLDIATVRKKGPPRSSTLWKWILVLGLGLLFVYRSTLPVLRLKPDPPQNFIYQNAREHRAARPLEFGVANAYWKVALESIQTKYSPRFPLPADPPPEFRINSKSLGRSEEIEAQREIYWQRLRSLWNLRESWRLSYGWNTDWFLDFLGNVGDYADQSVQRLVRAVQYWRDLVTQRSTS